MNLGFVITARSAIGQRVRCEATTDYDQAVAAFASAVGHLSGRADDPTPFTVEAADAVDRALAELGAGAAIGTCRHVDGNGTVTVECRAGSGAPMGDRRLPILARLRRALGRRLARPSGAGSPNGGFHVR
jgi:hypothetical protein